MVGLRSYHKFLRKLDAAIVSGKNLPSKNWLIFKGKRLAILNNLREDMPQRRHHCHLGIQSCLRRGGEALYWPRMNEDAKEFVSRCEVCTVFHVRQQKETMIGHDIPRRPRQIVG